MDALLRQSLELCETDVTGALKRFSGDEALYITCLSTFLEDPTMDMLVKAIDERSWDEAFTAAHALKGLAGNMGFVPLFHAVAELVLLIRAGRLSEIESSNKRVVFCYKDITTAIKRNIGKI